MYNEMLIRHNYTTDAGHMNGFGGLYQLVIECDFKCYFTAVEWIQNAEELATKYMNLWVADGAEADCWIYGETYAHITLSMLIMANDKYGNDMRNEVVWLSKCLRDFTQKATAYLDNEELWHYDYND